MGNRKFKLSSILPTSWFSKPHPPSPPPEPPLSGHPRKSYHITRELKPTTPKTLPRKPTSDSSTPTTKFSTSSSSSASLFRPPDHRAAAADDDDDGGDDIVIDVDKMSLNRKTEGSVLGLELAPIRTERRKGDAIDEAIKEGRRSVKGRGAGANGSFHVKVLKEESMASSVLKEQRNRCGRKVPTGSPRVRLRVNSPRIGRRAQINSGRRSTSGSASKKNILSESLALAKSSLDPQRDFRESMIEMIVTNDLSASKDLEELLACYLSLNSEEYHDLIIEAFKQIWFDLSRRSNQKQK